LSARRTSSDKFLTVTADMGTLLEFGSHDIKIHI
jgi:hypothetical protein